MNFPFNIKYTKTHEWVLPTESGGARIGVSDYAQNAMGDIVFLDLPVEGEELVEGEAFASLESVKSVEDVLSPVTGTVTEVNHLLDDSPELVNSDPYDSWLVEVEDITTFADLMDADEYEAYCETLA